MLIVGHTPHVPGSFARGSVLCRQDSQPSDIFSCIFPNRSMASANIPSLISITKELRCGNMIQLSKVVPKGKSVHMCCAEGRPRGHHLGDKGTFLQEPPALTLGFLSQTLMNVFSEFLHMHKYFILQFVGITE